MQIVKQKLATNSQKVQEFLLRYDELKLKNVRELDSFVYFLGEINDKQEVCTRVTLLKKMRIFDNHVSFYFCYI